MARWTTRPVTKVEAGGHETRAEIGVGPRATIELERGRFPFAGYTRLGTTHSVPLGHATHARTPLAQRHLSCVVNANVMSRLRPSLFSCLFGLRGFLK